MSDKLEDIYKILKNNYCPKKEQLKFKQEIQKKLLDVKNEIMGWKK